MQKVRLFMVLAMLTTMMGNSVYASEITGAGKGSVEAVLNAESAAFSVTVPMSLPIHVDSGGNVTVSDEAKLVNNSYGAVKVTNVEVVGANGWSVIDFDSDIKSLKVGAQEFGFMLNGGKTVDGALEFDEANYPVMAGANATDNDELALVYDAIVAPQIQSMEDEKIADVVFTLDWDGTDEEETPEVPEEPETPPVEMKNFIQGFGGTSRDVFQNVTPTSDGGYLAVGYSESTDAGFTNNGSTDAIIVKMDAEGTQEWVKNFGGSGVDRFNSVIKTLDGGYIAVGYSDSTNAGFTNKGGNDAIIVKYSADGTQEWVKNFGGSKGDFFTNVKPTSDGGYIAVGYSDSTNAGFTNKGGNDAIIVKMDAEGTQEWVKNFGGSKGDLFVNVKPTSDGGYIAVGYSDSTNAGFTGKGDKDAIIVKMDAEGTQEWVKNFGGSLEDRFESVIKTSDGGYIAVGYSLSNNAGFTNKGGYDGILVKYSADGTQEWIKNFGDIGGDRFFSVIKTSDGGYIAFGDSNSTNAGFTNKGGDDGIIVKYSADGTQEWVKNFGGNERDYIRSATETSDGGYVLVGESLSTDAGFTNKGGYDAIIVKMDAEGNYE